ncbi:unnamed protein product, partial [Heterosigma akashiwo]
GARGARSGGDGREQGRLRPGALQVGGAGQPVPAAGGAAGGPVRGGAPGPALRLRLP